MRVGLFVTCLADLMRPSVAFAAVKLLEDAGCSVEVPAAQTCCGQPALNSGDHADARAIAKNVIAAFEGFEAVVGPSGSCMGTLRHDYPSLFADEPAWRERAERLARRSHELLSFLVDVLKVERIDHGVRCVEDPSLVARLTAERVPLTVCPLSNVKLRVFDTLAHHNLARLLELGLCVTVNSDDPAYFGGYVNQNYTETFEALPALTAADAYTLARNSFEASFATAAQKARWVGLLDSHFLMGLGSGRSQAPA